MLEKIGSFIASVGLVVASWFGYTPEPEKVPITQVTNIPAPQSNYAEEETFGGFNPVGGQTYRLKTSIGTTDTTILLSSFKEPITGNNITMTTLNSDIAYATLDPQSSSRKEFISFTGVTQNSDGSATLTGVSRGLSFQYPFTASSTLRQAHPGQSILILSDSPQFFSEYARIRSNEVITGQWTFATFPITPSSSPASATTTGVVELATGAEAASSTLSGDIATSKLALHTGIATSAAPTSGNVVVVTGDDGNIDEAFLPATRTLPVQFTATTTGIGKITVYTGTSSTHTWRKATGTKIIDVHVFGGGGGGGGGASDNSATLGSGGAGGGGGGYTFLRLIGVTTTVSVTVGAGGTGGAGGALGNNNGVAGGNGGISSFGAYAVAGGGFGGAEGIQNGDGTDPIAGAGGTGLTSNGGAGGSGSQIATGTAPLAGGAGGDNGNGDGTSGTGRSTYFTQPGGSGGTGNVADPGDPGIIPFDAINTIGGSGGGGGEGGSGVTGGAGGAGIYGSGGGGGGSSNGGAGGVGGSGGAGVVVIIEY